ncbi:arsenate reductase ArsC [Pseudomonas aeruginosa]|nr:arsenate reductase ArsC [Pseudomonas aeruginosa]
MNILFLCTANSCRSILAEAVFNHLAPANMRAVSAGSKPCGWVHPQSLKALARAGIEQTGLYSKSQEVHAQLQPDVVITLCDNAANEPCPAYFDQAFKAHWGLADPAAQQGSEEEINAVFDQTVQVIRARVEQFLQLPLANLQAEQLQQELRRIGLLLPEAA